MWLLLLLFVVVAVCWYACQFPGMSRREIRMELLSFSWKLAIFTFLMWLLLTEQDGTLTNGTNFGTLVGLATPFAVVTHAVCRAIGGLVRLPWGAAFSNDHSPPATQQDLLWLLVGVSLMRR